jgi:ABC-type polysaccharide/polyol phosphate transport system ATPase subunit
VAGSAQTVMRPHAHRAARAAVSVERVSKSFRVPREKYTTVRERVVHPFKRRRHEVLRALRDVSFDVQPGEFFGVMGKNGSGKSTLLRCLAGIYPVDSGEIDAQGRLIPFIELGIGFDPELTARDNAVITAVMFGLPAREARRRFEEMIEFAELEDFVDLKLKNYSSGMAVRLAFAVTIHVEADVLLFDEVLAVGDAAFQEKCHAQFARLKAEGRTVILVTHAADAVRRFCDRALLLHRGQLREIGAPDAVAAAYAELNADPLERL